MFKFLISSGSLIAALSVIAGAFGAHALKTKLLPEQLAVFETAVKYMFFHAMAIIVCGVLMERFQGNNFILYAAYLFFAGIVLFSGSLYLLSCRDLLGIQSWKWLGPVTPLGGLAFISAWVLLAVSMYKNQN